jgi:hypothetical protein
MIRLALAVAMVSACLIATPVGMSAADARVNVNVNIGKGGSFGGRGITCGQGRRIVERRGFRNVRARSCEGRTFVYNGRRRGNDYRIEVRRRDGRIVDIERRRGGGRPGGGRPGGGRPGGGRPTSTSL